jgi:Fic family protein
MRRPFKADPLSVFSRATHDWVSRIARKHVELTELKPTEEQVREARTATDASFALSINAIDSKRRETPGLADPIKSLELLRSMADSNAGGTPELTPELLLRLHYASGAGPFRQHDPPDYYMTPPVRAEKLPAALAAACQWFEAESFVELNPIEQSAIAYLRLFELRPFDRCNESTGLLAASLFSVRRGLPPITVDSSRIEQYHAALDEAFQMNTSPMVELMAEAVEQTLEQNLRILKGAR